MLHRRTVIGAVVGTALAATLFVSAYAGDDGRDDATGGDRYSVDCRILMATDNDTIPPTAFGRYPSKGVLVFLAVGEVTNGLLGTTRLDGTKFAMFGRAAGDWKRGSRFEALSLYLDEAATPEQRKAMGRIFRANEVFRAEGMTALSTLTITTVRPTTDPLDPVTIKFGPEGSRGKLTMQPMKGADGRNPIAIHNAFSMFDDKEPVGLATASVNFSDHGREMKTTNASGEIHQARLSGTIHGIVEDTVR